MSQDWQVLVIPSLVLSLHLLVSLLVQSVLSSVDSVIPCQARGFCSSVTSPLPWLGS